MSDDIAVSGPSTHTSSSTSPRSPVQTAEESHTPRPTNNTVSQPPDAPLPKLIPKDLPLSTPQSSQTPIRSTDISEFDPFSTPAPQPIVPSQDVQTPMNPRNTVQGPSSTGQSRSTTEDGNGQTPSGEPSFNFSGFLRDLRTRSAEPIARYLKSFLSSFAKKPFTVNEQVKLIRDFLEFIEGKMIQCEPWKSQTSAEFDNAMEAMEKLVMNRLYNFTFTPQLVPSQPVTTDDLERDAVFSQRVRLFSWVRERHLDVPEGEASQGFLGFAEQELLKINHYKAPRDKMICILNCCKVIFGLIRHAYGANATSADAFVPILIFVVLRANPDNLLSNIEYINRFRSAPRLQGEAGYYLSSLSGAIAFIETMDASSLSNITQEEFENNVEAAIQDLPPSPTMSPLKPTGPSEMSPFAAATPGEEPARALSLSTSFPTLNNTRRFLQRTGNLASEAVSKPLNAIGKILDNMQQQDVSEDGSDSDVERSWKAGGSRDRESELRQEQNDSRETPRKQTSSRLQQMMTPETPSRQVRLLGENSHPPSGSTTPSGDIPLPDFSALQLQNTLEMSQDAYEQTRRANVTTLHQMFPALDEEIVEAVLEGCNNDLGVAIDKLLEM